MGLVGRRGVGSAAAAAVVVVLHEAADSLLAPVVVVALLGRLVLVDGGRGGAGVGVPVPVVPLAAAGLAVLLALAADALVALPVAELVPLARAGLVVPVLVVGAAHLLPAVRVLLVPVAVLPRRRGRGRGPVGFAALPVGVVVLLLAADVLLGVPVAALVAGGRADLENVGIGQGVGAGRRREEQRYDRYERSHEHLVRMSFKGSLLSIANGIIICFYIANVI
jgi:hypothetical protein